MTDKNTCVSAGDVYQLAAADIGYLRHSVDSHILNKRAYKVNGNILVARIVRDANLCRYLAEAEEAALRLLKDLIREMLAVHAELNRRVGDSRLNRLSVYFNDLFHLFSPLML